MNDVVTVIPEPKLEFRYGQLASDPHDGLTLFGPFDADAAQQPRSISYAVVGTPLGTAALDEFTRAWQTAIPAPDESDERLWPLFPGFEAAFACRWPPTPSKRYLIDRDALEAATTNLDPNIRTAEVVDCYTRELARAARSDDRLDVAICVVPDIVYERCRPESWVSKEEGTGHRPTAQELRERRMGQSDMFGSFDPRVYQFSVDFRRQIKARTMEYGVPIQIVKESTLMSEASFGRRRITCLSDRAWNLGVALYYKAGGKPWRLHTAREGVCYIGLAFRRERPEFGGRSAACAAQMFLDSGDGIVFMGRFGPWYSPARKSFHLSKEAAKELLEGALRTYDEQEGGLLKEVFLHCRSSIDPEEWDGFQAACPMGVKLVGVRVARDRRGIRLMRTGKYPVLRGTFWRIDGRSGLLWGSGFKQRLGTYDGWEIPVPLSVEIQQGTADIEQVASDILGLTKLNYNACRLGEGEPVTIGFSDKVGEVLVGNPGARHREPKFRFYV